MEKPHSEPKLNPRIKTVTIGISELREVKQYPLSASCQLSIPGLIGGFFESAASVGNTPEVDNTFTYFDVMASVIKTNISEILSFIFKEEAKVGLEDIDNAQLIEIVSNIIEVNYGEELGKKFVAIRENLKTLFPLMSLSQKSLEKPAIS